MKPALFAVAFAAAIAVAPFAFAQSGRNSGKEAPSSSAQTVPTPHPMIAVGGMMGGGMMGGGMGPAAAAGPWAGMGPGGRMMAWRNPKEACIDRVAHRAAMLAYIGTKLDLTAQQRPLWQKLAATARGEAQKEVDSCNALETARPANVLDRLTVARRILSTRLAGLDAALPEVKALYETLTPEQKAILNHPRGRP